MTECSVSDPMAGLALVGIVTLMILAMVGLLCVIDKMME